MQGRHEIAHLWAEHALHRSPIRRYHMYFDIARTERRRHFEPDEARTQHDGPSRRRGPLDDRATVGERPQHAHTRQLPPRPPHPAPPAPTSNQPPALTHP